MDDGRKEGLAIPQKGIPAPKLSAILKNFHGAFRMRFLQAHSARNNMGRSAIWANKGNKGGKKKAITGGRRFELL